MSSRALMLLAGALLCACGEEATPARTVEPPAGRPGLPTPDQVVENGTHIITVEGVKEAVVNAERLLFYDADGKVYGDTIQVQFFDETGAAVSTLTDKMGELDQETQQLIAREDVFVRGRDATIRTEELLYDPAADRISSDEPTEINQGGNVIRGQGVVSDTALRDIRVTSGSAVLRSDPERQGRETEAGDSGERRERPPKADATPPQLQERLPSQAVPLADDST
ncbi:MAG: LPS export ABC transporter periplasmic protein LptC [Gemmatimonadota bacterium]